MTSRRTSGVAIIGKGAVVATIVPGVDVTPTSFVLLTPKGNIAGRDLWFTTNAAANSFAIHLSSFLPVNLKVAWLLVG